MTIAGSATSRKRRSDTGADFVFTFSYESYSDAHKRAMMRPPDRLLMTLLAHPDVRRLVVADPYRSWTTNWVRSIIDRGHLPRDSERVTYVRPLRFGRADPPDLPGIRRTYAAYEASVRAAAGRSGLRTPALITANPLVAGFSDLTWTRGAVYYARDDWLSSPARRAYWPAYQGAYRRIAQTGVAVAAVSRKIIERIKPTGPHCVVPNGIEAAEWLGTQPAAPEWFARIPGPRAVYVGTLDSRLDVDGLRILATARPDLQIVLVGPAPDPADLAALRPLPSVHIRGTVGRREVIAVLRNAEMTLLAHRRTPLTEAMSPLKVYEYLGAGRPVLATDFEPVRGLGPRVLLAESVPDFVDLVDDALALGVQSEPERRAFIEANAWPSRHAEILSLLDGSPR